MKKKLLAGLMALTMLFSNGLCVAMAAASREEVAPEYGVVESSEKEHILETEAEIASNANVMERAYDGQLYALDDGIDAYSEETEDVPNTDPNNAHVVVNNTVTPGTISAAGEMRWYAFVMNERGKATIYLQLPEALDADLYVFALNDETSQLEMIGGSAVEGKGATELYKEVLDAGIYFFAVGGYEGTGDYQIAFLQSSADAAYEVNDSFATAATVGLNQDIVGVIDSPWDMDFYQFTITEATIIQYSISSSDGYRLLFGGDSNGSTQIGRIDEDAKIYKFLPGTYYFAVISSGGAYSTDNTYMVNFKRISKAASGWSAHTWWNEEAGILYEANADYTDNYVNGHWINISYSYKEDYSNSYGLQTYDITIDTSLPYQAACIDPRNTPIGAHYWSSTHPIKNVSSRPALMLTFVSSSNNFYRINCNGTGEYKQNKFNDSTNYVTVMIDPQSGDLIDIVEFNYFYHHNPGSNKIVYGMPYLMNEIK